MPPRLIFKNQMSNKGNQGRRGMQRAMIVTVVALSMLSSTASAAFASPPPGPSCNGVFSSSAAGQPGHVADAAHFVKDLADQLGVPSGSFTSAGAHVHGASLADCTG